MTEQAILQLEQQVALILGENVLELLRRDVPRNEWALQLNTVHKGRTNYTRNSIA